MDGCHGELVFTSIQEKKTQPLFIQHLYLFGHSPVSAFAVLKWELVININGVGSI